MVEGTTQIITLIGMIVNTLYRFTINNVTNWLDVKIALAIVLIICFFAVPEVIFRERVEVRKHW